jgi:hypothetical protein
MSLRPLFSKLRLFRKAPLIKDAKASSEAQVSKLLREYFRQSIPPTLGRHVLLLLRDPFLAKGGAGFRLRPLWAAMATLGILMLSVFFYFNVVRS